MLAVLVVLGLAATAVYLGTRDDSPGGSGAASAATDGQPVIAGVSAFDPFGDGQEDDLHAAQAVDGAAATVPGPPSSTTTRSSARRRASASASTSSRRR